MLSCRSVSGGLRGVRFGGLVEDVGGAFGAFVDAGGDGFDFEAGALEAVGEFDVGASGPENGGAAGLEHGLDGANAGLGVEGGVAFLHHGDGAVVDVEQEAVVGFGRCFAENGGGVGDLQVDAGIVDAFAVEVL